MVLVQARTEAIVVAPAEEITLDKWAGRWPDAIAERERATAEGDTDFAPIAGPWEEALALKWEPRYPDLIAGRRPQPFVQLQPDFGALLAAEDVTLDKWAWRWPDHIAKRRRATALYGWALQLTTAQFPEELALKWQPLYPDLIAGRRLQPFVESPNVFFAALPLTGTVQVTYYGTLDGFDGGGTLEGFEPAQGILDAFDGTGTLEVNGGGSV